MKLIVFSILLCMSFGQRLTAQEQEAMPNPLPRVEVVAYRVPLVEVEACFAGTPIASQEKPLSAKERLLPAAEAGSSPLFVSEESPEDNWQQWQAQRRPDGQAWEQALAEAYRVQVENREGRPVPNCRAQLWGRDGELLWEAKTNTKGEAWLWRNGRQLAGRIEVQYEKEKMALSSPMPFNKVELDVPCPSAKGVDLVFAIDATHSMRDEFEAIIGALAAVEALGSGNRLDLQVGATIFRDFGEPYLSRSAPLGAGLIEEKKSEWRACGGGGPEEALDTALMAALTAHHWRADASARLLVFFTDALPSQGQDAPVRLAKAMRLAAASGITILPIACSGLDEGGAHLLRAMALATNGAYLQTYPNGGSSKPGLEQWSKTLARKWEAAIPCQETQGPMEEVHFFPNPAAVSIQLHLPISLQQLRIFASTGEAVYQNGPMAAGKHEITLGQWPAGAYWIECKTKNETQRLPLIISR